MIFEIFSIISDFFLRYDHFGGACHSPGPQNHSKGCLERIFLEYIFFLCRTKFQSRFFQNCHENYLGDTYLPTPDSQKRYYDIQAILRKAPKGATMKFPNKLRDNAFSLISDVFQFFYLLQTSDPKGVFENIKNFVDWKE